MFILVTFFFRERNSGKQASHVETSRGKAVACGCLGWRGFRYHLFPNIPLILSDTVWGAGIDCEKAQEAVTTSCMAFGEDSQPCEILQRHHNAECTLGEDLRGDGDGAAKEASGAVNDIQATIKLANDVYDKAQKMCKCQAKEMTAVANAVTKKTTPTAPKQVAPKPAAPAAPAKVPKPEKHVPLSDQKKKENRQEAKMKGQGGVKLSKGELLAAKKHAQPVKSLKKLEAKGEVSGKAAKEANKLSGGAEAELAKEVKKEEKKEEKKGAGDQ